MRWNAKSPSMALNAVGATPYFNMDNNYQVPEDHLPVNILEWVSTVAKGQKDKKIKTLVIHGHGGGIANGTNIIGKTRLTFGYSLNIGTGISRENTNLFKALKGWVEEIYITACGAAQGTNGELMCKEIAGYSGAPVFASPDEQWAMGSVPPILYREWRMKNMVEIDGVVWCYEPRGSSLLMSSN